MATPPADISPCSNSMFQTSNSTLDTSPEAVLARSHIKRTSLGSELGDTNDTNEMAPSSAILYSDLVMSDVRSADDVADKAVLVNLAQSPLAPAPKRARYSNLNDELTASDYAQLKPVIQPESKGVTFSRSTSHPLSRKRAIADLIHPSSQCSPVNMDESEATVVYGEPVDSSSSTLSIDISEGEEPTTPALTTRYPGSHIATDNLPRPKSATGMKDTNKDVSGHSSANSTRDGNKQRTLPAAPSSLFMPSHHSAGPRRNSTSNSKKGFQRPVRIQLLDEAESDKIREEERRASSPSYSSLTPEQEMLWEDSRSQNQDSDAENSRDVTLRNNVDDDQSIVLPIEDPIVHDWDVEELDDEDSEGRATPPIEDSTLASEVKKSRRRSIEKTISRMAGNSDEGLSLKSARIQRAPTGDTASAEDQDAGRKEEEEEEEEEDRWDPMLDPEREVSSMSEDQELELHNTHLRLENQREFQDTSSLDLGEGDDQAVSEDGRYGGAIEADDEGEDFWENR
ncbi:hypothetical protein BGX27_008153 [Mortierella sp. AM989]|nr:hypothetical protein BGX27_008153 [Mortierella sp. AM989]